MRTVGTGTRCARETTSRATETPQPNCSGPDPKCGNDKRCSTGNQGCNCKEDEEKQCPSGEYTLFCDECGDADQNNKCKGVSRYLSSLKMELHLIS